MDYFCQGKTAEGKLEAVLGICAELGITLDDVAYIGDDVNCVDLLERVGLAACPSDAVDRVKSISGIHIMSRRGGDACVREFIDHYFFNE